MRAACLLLLLGAVAAPLPARGDLRLTASPAEIREGLFWSGGTLRVRGEVGPGDLVVVRVLGEVREETWVLRQRHGPFWLPAERAVLEDAPQVYLLQSERPLAELLLPMEAEEAGLGEGALEKGLGLLGDRSYLVSELFRRWRASGRLAVVEDGVFREGGRFQTTFALPARLPEGFLRIEAFACREGRMRDRCATEVPVRRVGLAALLAGGARHHPVLYGLGAVLLALVLGLLVGVLFPRGRPH